MVYNVSSLIVMNNTYNEYAENHNNNVIEIMNFDIILLGINVLLDRPLIFAIPEILIEIYFKAV